MKLIKLFLLSCCLALPSYPGQFFVLNERGKQQLVNDILRLGGCFSLVSTYCLKTGRDPLNIYAKAARNYPKTVLFGSVLIIGATLFRARHQSTIDYSAPIQKFNLEFQTLQTKWTNLEKKIISTNQQEALRKSLLLRSSFTQLSATLHFFKMAAMNPEIPEESIKEWLPLIQGQIKFINDDLTQINNLIQPNTPVNPTQKQPEPKIAESLPWHTVLGVAENAPDETVKKAFRALAKKWHSDKNPELKDNNMQIINSAYDNFKHIRGLK